MRKIIALALVLGLTACAQAPKQYLMKDVSAEQRTRDEAKCENEAMRIDTADYEYRGTFMEGANIQAKQKRAYVNCMIAEGYDLVNENEVEAYKARKAGERSAADTRNAPKRKARKR